MPAPRERAGNDEVALVPLRLPQRQFAREPLVEAARHVRVHDEGHVADVAQHDALRAVRRGDFLDLSHHHHQLVTRTVDALKRRPAARAQVLLVLEPERLGHEQDMGQGFLLGLAAGRGFEQRAAHHEPAALARHLGMPVRQFGPVPQDMEQPPHRQLLACGLDRRFVVGERRWREPRRTA